jgi:tripartite-type tricarboxylate transporter receptor subunit TctC
VSPALPVRTLAEFVAYAAAHPGELNYATGGVGSSNHVDAEMFRSAAKLDLVHVPYNGPSAGIAAVASGDTQMMIVSITTGLGLAQGGRVRPLAVFATARSPLLPSVPTAGEQGFAGLDLTAWIGLVAPAGTPPAIVERVHGEIARILGSADTVAWAQRHGLEIADESSASFARTIERDHARWGKVIRDLRIPPR